MDKIVVIGSNSFSGSSFIKSLLSAKKNVYEIHAISRSIQPIEALHPATWPKKDFKFYQLHMVDDIKKIIDLIDNIKPPYIVNYAAQSMVAQSWDVPEDWFETNCVATVKLFNYLSKAKYLKKYVHISTPEVYGNCVGSVNEKTPFNPTTPYAISRAAGDMTLKAFYEAYNFPFILTRAANVYGPGQALYRIIPKTIYSILNKQKLKLHGGGVSERSFIHIDDVSSATLSLILKGKIGETYHISTEQLISIKRLVEQICNTMNVDFNDIVELDDERLGKDMIYDLDSTKIKKEIKWRSLIELTDGVNQVVEWMTSNINILNTVNSNYIHKR